MATLPPPVEQTTIDGGRKRFIAITGGAVAGPLFEGAVLPGGHARVEARYFLETADGTVIQVTNPGVRTTPRFVVPAGAHEWMRRSVFVARGIRRPDRVEIDFYIVH